MHIRVCIQKPHYFKYERLNTLQKNDNMNQHGGKYLIGEMTSNMLYAIQDYPDAFLHVQKSP